MTIIWLSKVLLVIVHFFWLTIYGQAGVAFCCPPYHPSLLLYPAAAQVQLVAFHSQVGWNCPALPAPLTHRRVCLPLCI